MLKTKFATRLKTDLRQLVQMRVDEVEEIKTMAKIKQNKTKCRPREKRGQIAPSVTTRKQMQSKLTELVYDVHVQPGEAPSVPANVADLLGSRHLRVSISAADDSGHRGPVRNHMAFLNSYAPEDEGLYDDYSAR